MQHMVIAVMVAGLSMFATNSALAEQGEMGSEAIPSLALLGPWSFATEPYRGGACLLRGSIVVRSDASDENRFEIDMTAYEICGEESSTAVQSCDGHLKGSRFLILCEVNELLEEIPEFVVYHPDNFDLRVESATRMRGMLRSFASAPAEFIRPNGAIS